MDTAVLVEPQIDDGYRLLVDIARAGVEVEAAAWVRIADADGATLYVGVDGDNRKRTDANVALILALQADPGSWVTMSDVRVVPASHPVIRDVAALRDRFPGGRLAARYGGKRLGGVAIESAYIYPRVTGGMTRDEVIRAVTGLMSRAGQVPPSTVTLRDGTSVRGTPYGLELVRNPGAAAAMEVKLRDAADGSTRHVRVDDVANFQ